MVNKGAKIEELLKSGVTETAAIVEALGKEGLSVNPRYVRNIRTEFNKTLAAPTAPPSEGSPPPPLTTEAEDPITLEAIPESEAPPTPEQVAASPAVQIALGKKDITAMFQAVNGMLPVKYQREKDQMELLGAVWEAPLNRMVGKYLDKNSDLYIAVIMTILVFMPVGVAIVQDRTKKPKFGAHTGELSSLDNRQQ